MRTGDRGSKALGCWPIARRFFSRPLLALIVAGCALAVVPAGSSTRGRESGIFRVSFSPNAGLDYVDPALSFTQPGWALLDATCARLLMYPDKPAPAAYRLERDVAADYRISGNFKTYTFTLR